MSFRLFVTRVFPEQIFRSDVLQADIVNMVKERLHRDPDNVAKAMAFYLVQGSEKALDRTMTGDDMRFAGSVEDDAGELDGVSLNPAP